MQPDNPPDLGKIFNKFAGCEVPMKEEQFTPRNASAPVLITRVILANPRDPVLQQMSDEAAKNGLGLRLQWPGNLDDATGAQAPTPHDYCKERVNATIEQGPDGKWRVGAKFTIG
jgi:hypothetical protein